METADMQKLLDDTFEDVARVMEGIFAVHGVEDEVVWQVMKHLGMCHDTALAKLDGLGSAASPRSSRRPHGTHPAVEALLIQLKTRRSPDARESEES